MRFCPFKFTNMVTHPYGIQTTDFSFSLTAWKKVLEKWLKVVDDSLMSQSSVTSMVAPRSKGCLVREGGKNG